METQANAKLTRLAHERRSAAAETVSRGERVLRQEQMGQELNGAMRDDESAWLDADLG